MITSSHISLVRVQSLLRVFLVKDSQRLISTAAVIALIFLSGACLEKPQIKNLNASKDSASQVPPSEERVYFYYPQTFETRASCDTNREGLRILSSSMDVEECRGGVWLLHPVGRISMNSTWPRGRVYAYDPGRRQVVAQFVPQMSLPPVSLNPCEGIQHSEKPSVQVCTETELGSSFSYGASVELSFCQSALSTRRAILSPAGEHILSIGPSGVPARVMCVEGESLAMAVARGSFISQCPAGQFSGPNGLCQACPAGSYQDQVGQTQCRPCTHSISGPATSVVFDSTQSGLSANSCTIASVQCASGYRYEASLSACVSEAVTNCPAGQFLNGGSCSACPGGTFKSTNGVGPCSPCTNKPAYALSVTYNPSQSGLTTNTCEVQTGSCQVGFSWNLTTKTCVADYYVPTFQVLNPNLQACDGTVTLNRPLVSCHNPAGDPVDLSLCPPSQSETYFSPAGSRDAVALGLIIGLSLSTEVEQVRVNCGVGETGVLVDATNFQTLWEAGRIQVMCDSAYWSDPFLWGSQIKCHSRARVVGLGVNHGCVSTELGSVLCWGIQSNGRLGNNSASRSPLVQSSFPQDAARVCADSSCNQRLTDIVSVSSGNEFSCALNSLGDVFCWGRNHLGQLGLGNTTQSAFAQKIPTLLFDKVVAGATHVCGIERSTSKVRCWGDGAKGGLGNTTTTTLTSPTTYVAKSTSSTDHLLGVVDLALGDKASCAVVGTQRELWCWGSGTNGRTGLNTTTARSYASPVMINYTTNTPLVNVHKVSGYAAHFCAIAGGSRQLYCWGAGANGRLGTGLTSDASVPQLINTSVLGVVQDVVVGSTHTCVIAGSSSKVYCVGLNNTGQLGYGAFSTTTSNPDYQSLTWKEVSGLPAVNKLFGGADYTCAQDVNQALWCWGKNTNRVLRLGDTTTRSSAQKMLPF